MSLQIKKYMDFALQNVADGRCYPVIVPQDTEPEFPYVIYAMNGMTEQGNKDGVYGDTCLVEVLIFARDVDELETTAQSVRNSMEEAFSTWQAQEEVPFYVDCQEMSAGAEDYSLDHDGYFLPLNYTIETSKPL